MDTYCVTGTQFPEYQTHECQPVSDIFNNKKMYVLTKIRTFHYQT